MKKFLDYLAKKFAAALVDRIGLDELHIVVMNIQPGDYIVVKSNKSISQMGWERLKSALQELFPNNKVIALEDTLDLFVMRGLDKAKGK